MRIEIKDGKPEINSEHIIPRLTKLGSKILHMRGQIASLQLCLTIRNQITTDWRKPHLTREPSYSFLRHGDRHICVVRELLPPGVRIFTENDREEWLRDPHNSPAYAKEYTAVPPNIPVVYFSQVAVGICTECEKNRPIIRERILIEDGISYERIKRTDMVVCFTCGEIGSRGTVTEYVKID